MKIPNIDISQLKNRLNKIIFLISTKRLSNKGRLLLLVFFCGFIIIETLIFRLWVKNFKKNQIIQLTIPTTPVVPVTRPSTSAQSGAETKTQVLPEDAETRIRDPFLTSLAETDRLLATSGKIFAGVTLTGILWDEKTPSAIINGQVYKVGDVVIGKTITKIERDRVILEAEGVEYTILMWSR